MISDIYEIFKSQQNFTIIIVLLISVLVDISKIPLNPWKHVGRLLKSFLKYIGNIMVEDQIKNLKCQLAEWQKQTLRRNILRFADECRLEQSHSREMFDDILRDIGRYENVCVETDDPNHKISEAILRIKEIHHECEVNNNFL